MKRFLIATVIASTMVTLILSPATAFGTVIVDDSWVDGGRTDGADALDTAWWSATSSNGNSIEVYPGILGMISGTSGRGIYGTFANQTLGIGDTLTATYTFTTPATVTSAGAGGANFRVGLFDKTSNALWGTADVQDPNNANIGLKGYMMDFDVGPTTTSTNIGFREHTTLTGNAWVLKSTTDYTTLGSGGGSYTFTPNTSYTGVWSLTRTGTDSLDLSGSLYQGATLLSTFTTNDASGIVGTIGMIGFQANAGVFGSTTTAGQTQDNGIDFTNIKIEYLAVPEPSTLTLGLIGLAGLMFAKSRGRR